MKVLFICKGNVGRSQMAEEIFRSLTNGKYEAVSAGTRVVNNEGESRNGKTLSETTSAAHVLEVLAEMGIDAGKNTRTQLERAMVEQADKVIVMAELETIPEYIEGNIKVQYWTVADPFSQSLEFTRNIRDQIKTLVAEFIESNGLDRQV